eukprot:TRINITY_DN2255_c0_g1_i12.p1 TRINITY_DN2255_c0_g1~~TRINITY_DN2255_c0_g1_i12.p1  ORF type:complete len:310 (-),score=36.94 TRINITY_DN2255_c0_g1_i12:327-1256(-)
MFFIVRFLITCALPSIGLSISNANALASGSTPSSAALAAASATGANAAGQATIAVTPSSAFASASAVATGPVVGKTHHPVPKVHRPVPTPKYHPTPAKKVAVTPKCDDVHECKDIDSVHSCGYCMKEKYPTKGKGCVYGSDYTPRCECKGTFIHDKTACPSCESVLEELLECAKLNIADDFLQIPTSCLTKVKVTVEYLEKCGYIHYPEETKKVVVPSPSHSKKVPATVVVRPIYPTGKTHQPTPPVKASAFASASASSRSVRGATVANADATAIATGQGSTAKADASAIAIGRGSLVAANAQALAQSG